ncbi:hypothetical protein B0I35DRAFT_363580 [Stachybotrys elegans]|uniref:Peptidase M13 C-terminal domain-containing protein n=1 Tax=Stachybotrys elegans TaxID=80388 RepID=A0A8K0SEU3_9HYPO|nr:hypothetical protein B0I35DRAFT_363580 [Stachybotrys elegans]
MSIGTGLGASGSVCTSPACVHAASEILKSLATNYTDIDPCTNFAQYACGNWPTWNEIPAGHIFIDARTSLAREIYSIASGILDNGYPEGSSAGWITVDLTEEEAEIDKRNFDKLQHAYQTCLTTHDQDEEGLQALVAFVQDVTEAFQVAAGSSPPFDLASAMGRTLTIFETYGIGTTQNIFQRQNNWNPNETHIHIMAPLGGETLPDDKELAETYMVLASELLSALHPQNIAAEHARRLLGASLEIQEQINNFAIMSQIEEAQLYMDNPLDAYSPRTSLSDLQARFPELNLDHVVRQLAPSGYSAERIAVPPSSYFENITQLITTTPSDVLQTYFVWTAISTLAGYVDSDVTRRWNDFRNVLQGSESRLPRWERCIGFLDEGAEWLASHQLASFFGPSGMTWILTRFFIDNHYTPAAENLTSHITKYLSDGFAKRLENADWISRDVKNTALRKIHSMVFATGFPTDPDTINPTTLEEYYSDIIIADNHLENVLSLAKAAIGKRWSILERPSVRGQFKMSSLAATAYQDWQLNSARLLAGIQQFPFFDVTFPSYLLFGGIGSVVGHEITHGFDHLGRQYDASGNMSSWWDEESVNRFVERSACFVEQYSNFTFTAPNGTQVMLNGTLSLNENIADAGGVATSYLAWKQWEEREGRAMGLPGLQDFTNEQLFFIRWGQIFCRNSPAEVDIAGMQMNTHAPHDARIMLTLQNNVGFKEAFDCPTKEPTCELW